MGDYMNIKTSISMFLLGVTSTLLYQQIKSGNFKKIVKDMNRAKTQMIDDIEDMLQTIKMVFFFLTIICVFAIMYLEVDNMNKEIINEEEFDLICKYIKIRYESSISQRELAKKIGIAQSTIARMEKNMHSMSIGNFTKLLDVLGYKLDIVKKEK